MKECPVCKKLNEKEGSLQFLEVDKIVPLNLDYFICSCSFMYYRFDNISKSYSENNKYINRNTGSGADISFDIKRLNNSYSNIYKYLLDCESLLDIGCNNGTFLEIIKENHKNIKLYGSDVEISESKLQELTSEGINVLKTINITDFGILFDFISINHVLEHIDDINGFIDQLNNTISSKGKIYIEVPDASRYLDYYFQPYSYFDLEHINHFNIENLEFFLNAKGFRVVEKYLLDLDMSNNIKYPAIGVLFEKDSNLTVQLNQNISLLKNKLFEYINKSNNELNKYSYRESLDGKVLFGVGANTLRTIGLLNKDIKKVKYFVDNNSIFHERLVNEITIKSSTYLIQDNECPDVIIFSKLYFDEIKNDLVSRGFKGCIYSFF
jgi:2-polyprenyl-3-methyl-5-hydroxy-6-metoxy-1,4-benzoquinol methylase